MVAEGAASCFSDEGLGFGHTVGGDLLFLTTACNMWI